MNSAEKLVFPKLHTFSKLTSYQGLLSTCIVMLCVAMCAPLVYNADWGQAFVIPKVLWFCIFTELSVAVVLSLLALQPATRKYFWNPVLLSLFVFGFSLTTSGLYGVSSGRSLWGTWNRFEGVFLWWHVIAFACCLAYCLRARAIWRLRVVYVVLSVAGVAALYGILEFCFGSLLFSDPSLPRAASFFGNPIYFGSFLTIPLFLSLYMYGEKQKSSWWWVAAVIIAGGVVVSVSRGVWVGVAFGTLYAVVVWQLLLGKSGPSFIRYRKYLVSGVVVFALLGLVLARAPIFNRITQLSDTNVRSRLLLWGMAWRGFAEHPLLGVGPGNFSVINDQFYNPVLYQYHTPWNDKPHNAILEILVTQGIVGFAFFVAVIISTQTVLVRAYRRRTLSSWQFATLSGGLFAYLVQNFFAFDTVSALFVYAVLLAFISSFQDSTDTVVSARNGCRVLFARFTLATSVFVVVLVIVRVCYPIARAAAQLEQAVLVSPSEPERAVTILKQVLQDDFVPNRGFIALLYSERVLAVATTSTPDHILLLEDASRYIQTAQRGERLELQYWLKLNDVYIRETLLKGSQSFAEASAAVREATRLAPSRAEPLFASAILASAMDQPTQARDIARKALTLDPDNSRMQWFAVRLLVDEGKVDQAQVEARSLVARDVWPSRVDDLQWLFDLYVKGNDTQSLTSLLDGVVAQYTDNAAFQFKAAKVYASLGQEYKARKILQQLKKDPREVSPSQIEEALGSLLE